MVKEMEEMNATSMLGIKTQCFYCIRHPDLVVGSPELRFLLLLLLLKWFVLDVVRIRSASNLLP